MSVAKSGGDRVVDWSDARERGCRSVTPHLEDSGLVQVFMAYVSISRLASDSMHVLSRVKAGDMQCLLVTVGLQYGTSLLVPFLQQPLVYVICEEFTAMVDWETSEAPGSHF
jgi:hypothetical protein